MLTGSAAPGADARPAEKVLVVEDDEFIREALHELLRDEGYEVEVASDGGEALQAMRSTAPDLVVLDLLMPRFNGWGLLAALREEPSLATVPVVVTTAVPHAAPAGCRACLRKPYTFSELLSAMTACGSAGGRAAPACDGEPRGSG